MGTKRLPKFKRKPEEARGLWLQERDVEIIKLVHDYRFINSEQLQALVDGSNQVILRRLKKLFHYGFLDRPLAQIVYPLIGNQKMVYALSDKGADLLAEQLEIDRGKIAWEKKNQEAKDKHIQHTLMISNFRVCLTLALKNIPKTKLLFWQRENPKELKDYAYIEDSRGREKRVAIVPDGFFSIRDQKGKMYFFLEADQSTMTNARFLNKVKGYWQWWTEGGQTKKFGIKNFRVLTITKSKSRKQNLRKVTKLADDKQTGSYMFWFASERNYDIEHPDTILEPIWQTPVDDSYHSILE